MCAQCVPVLSAIPSSVICCSSAHRSHSSSTKEKTPILSFISYPHRSWILPVSSNVRNDSKQYSINGCSITAIASIPVSFQLLATSPPIYSIALANDIAPTTLGVPGSKLSGVPIYATVSEVTSATAPPHTFPGVSFLSKDFFHHNTPVPVRAPSLCPVKKQKSQPKSDTSSDICTTA